MLDSIKNLLQHYLTNKGSINVSISLSKNQFNSRYLTELFELIGKRLSIKNAQEDLEKNFIAKYNNKLFESGIFQEDKEMDKKYLVVDYKKEDSDIQPKRLNAFYRVEDAMEDSMEFKEVSL